MGQGVLIKNSYLKVLVFFCKMLCTDQLVYSGILGVIEGQKGTMQVIAYYGDIYVSRCDVVLW